MAGLPFLHKHIADGSVGRLDSLLGGFTRVGSRSRAQKLLDQGRVKVNGRDEKPSYKVKPGDAITVRIPAPVPLEAVPEPIPIDVPYEDQDLVVVNKARGMVVHPAPGNRTGTLVNALLSHCRELSGIGGVQRPGIVHRIDKDTSGLLVVAKSDLAHESLSAQLKEHSVERVYMAVLVGIPKEDAGRIATRIGRHPVDRKRMAVVAKGGKESVTNWRLLEAYKGYSLVECRLETGRTHQIRVHMAHMGYPLVGDPVYGRERDNGRLGNPLRGLIKGQALHAGVLGFRHPRTGEVLSFSAPLPGDMQAVVDFLRDNAGR